MLQKLMFLLFVVCLCSSAAPPEAEQQVRALKTALHQADDAYFNQHQPVLSDTAYDALRNRYDRLLADYPELAGENPVGAPAAESGRVVHDAPVLSLEKACSDDALTRFLRKTGTNLLYCVEPKLDGVTVVLRYRDGLLVQALTRGDGKTGTDVTYAVLASGAVPAALACPVTKLDVRGEMILPLPAFEKLNRRRAESGQAPLKNPRNIASGSLMLTDYAEVARRGLEFQCFELLACEGRPATHTESLAFLEKTGLPVIKSFPVQGLDVLAAVKNMNRQRADFPFATDGLVIKVNDLDAARQLGATAHHPRSAVARKYEEIPVLTRLLTVEWSRGVTGKQTPVAVFEPVQIQGATIRRATLHNGGYIRAMDLKIGDWILVIRSGGTVPEITGNLPERRTGTERPIPIPAD